MSERDHALAPRRQDTPSLAEMMTWLAEMPAVFRAKAGRQNHKDGEVRTDAVIGDLLATVVGQPASEELLDALRLRRQADQVWLSWCLRAAWILWNPALRQPQPKMLKLEALILQELPALAALVPVEALDDDQARREELIRRVLRAMGRRPAGESARQARDRLKQVDAVEQHALLVKAQQREKRAREVRAALARKAAEEAAAKVSRE